jgi:hypothetical protein
MGGNSPPGKNNNNEYIRKESEKSFWTRRRGSYPFLPRELLGVTGEIDCGEKPEWV